MTVDLITRNEFSELKKMLHEILERLPKQTVETKKEFLTAKEVKEILKCSDSTLANYRKSNLLMGKKFGGRFYYDLESVNKVLTLN